jgi:hypothetical protein
VDEGDLTFEDLWGIRRLKYLRNRSLSNPSYRDSRFVRKFVSESQTRWTRESPLTPGREAVIKSLDEYERLLKRQDRQGSDLAWGLMLESVDALVAEGERLHGKRIKPGAW